VRLPFLAGREAQAHAGLDHDLLRDVGAAVARRLLVRERRVRSGVSMVKT
jgi:hypothetical protein